MKTYLDIPHGGTNDKECEWLQNVAKDMNSIVEIGSYMGRSTVALLSGISSTNTLYAVDPFDTSPTGIYAALQDSNYATVYSTFLENTKDFKNLKVIRDTSRNAAMKLQNEIFDMIFIDGEHSYNAVLEDINLWLPKTKKILCGHDYNKHYDSVVKAVDKILSGVEVYESIWIKRLSV